VTGFFGVAPQVAVQAVAKCRLDHWLAAHHCFGEVLEGSRQRRTRKPNRKLAHRRVAVALTEERAQGGESETISPNLVQQADTGRGAKETAEGARLGAGSLGKLGGRARTAHDPRRKVEARRTGDDVRELIAAHQLGEAGRVSLFKTRVEGMRICHGTSVAQPRVYGAPWSTQAGYAPSSRHTTTPKIRWPGYVAHGFAYGASSP
jgi:hypothetical protein